MQKQRLLQFCVDLLVPPDVLLKRKGVGWSKGKEHKEGRYETHDVHGGSLGELV